jgi:hypothetical protein
MIFALAKEHARWDEAAAAAPHHVACLLVGASTPGPAGHPWKHPRAVDVVVPSRCAPRLEWSSQTIAFTSRDHPEPLTW